MIQENTAPDELPPLPESDVQWVDGRDQYGYDTYDSAYSAEAMQAYARAALARPSVPQEPAIWLTQKEFDVLSRQPKGERETVPLYAAPVATAAAPSVEPADQPVSRKLVEAAVAQLSDACETKSRDIDDWLDDAEGAIRNLRAALATPAATTPAGSSREPATFNVGMLAHIAVARPDLIPSMQGVLAGSREPADPTEDRWYYNPSEALTPMPKALRSRAAETAGPNSVHQAEASAQAPGAVADRSGKGGA